MAEDSKAEIARLAKEVDKALAEQKKRLKELADQKKQDKGKRK